MSALFDRSQSRGGKAAAALLAAAGGILVTWAQAGHELPVYPSYYPHEIAIETMTPERAADLLRDNKLHAYLGPQPTFAAAVPATIHTVETLGSLVLVRLNPASAAARDSASSCAMAGTILAGMAASHGFVFHPYPVTPFHGDYLHFADLADALRARLLAESSSPTTISPKVRLGAARRDLIRSDWIAQGPEWDAAIEAVDVDALMSASMTWMNGWIGPPWLKSGWFHADRVLADALDEGDAKARAETLRARLEASEEHDAVERTNLERELVGLLAGNCRKVVAGYTVKRQLFNAEFTEGIENIGFDSIAGLNSPMFLRTVKLKDFPWNGWLTLGIDAGADAAFNPIAGLSDPFGRLLWSAIGDPALLLQPYDSGWMLNRISDVRSSSGR